MAVKPDAPATHRNRDAILDVLRIEFAGSTDILEIGSGTGQHAVYFARELPAVCWHTSDRPENIAGIQSWIEDSAIGNVIAPIELDVLAIPPIDREFDAVFSANTAHIMSFSAVTCMFRLAGEILSQGGVFCLYGPFNENGTFTSESNRSFDQSLRRQDPTMGIRDLGTIDALAEKNGLRRKHRYTMPANNMIVIWQK